MLEESGEFNKIRNIYIYICFLNQRRVDVEPSVRVFYCTCKMRSPSRMRPSLAAMLFGQTCWSKMHKMMHLQSFYWVIMPSLLAERPSAKHVWIVRLQMSADAHRQIQTFFKYTWKLNKIHNKTKIKCLSQNMSVMLVLFSVKLI